MDTAAAALVELQWSAVVGCSAHSNQKQSAGNKSLVQPSACWPLHMQHCIEWQPDPIPLSAVQVTFPDPEKDPKDHKRWHLDGHEQLVPSDKKQIVRKRRHTRPDSVGSITPLAMLSSKAHAIELVSSARLYV